MTSVEGRGDRLRAAAFAEFQAREAFLWAAETFAHEPGLPSGLTEAWQELARQEDKHMKQLLRRLEELGQSVRGRPVSDFLWKSFMSCDTAERFARFMASAEERGRIAGERFYEAISPVDAETAEIFKQIALEEIEHIRLAERYFPVLPNPPAPRDVAPRL